MWNENCWVNCPKVYHISFKALKFEYLYVYVVETLTWEWKCVGERKRLLASMCYITVHSCIGRELRLLSLCQRGWTYLQMLDGYSHKNTIAYRSDSGDQQCKVKSPSFFRNHSCTIWARRHGALSGYKYISLLQYAINMKG